MTVILLNALLPIFVGLLLGYVAGRRGVMDNQNVRNLIVLVMDFAIPCALFATINGTSWTVLREQSETAVMIAVVFVALYAASYFWAKKASKCPSPMLLYLRSRYTQAITSAKQSAQAAVMSLVFSSQ
jgi:malonate transporter and related proteins